LTALLSYNHWFIICILVSLYSCSKDGDSEISDNTIQLNIDVQSEIPTDHKVNMTLTITEGGQPKTYTGRIERRGGFSISFPKQSFEIDLEEDISLAGLPSDDDWILNANYIDKTFLRHVISYDLFQQMSPNNIASQTQYVEVSINQIYNGLYVLMEKLDKSSLGINDKDSSAFIFKEPHIFRDSYDGIQPQDNENFHQQTYPKIEKEDKSQEIEDLREFILHSSANEFSSGIVEWLDIESIIDWHLLLLITNNSDGILKNFYLYKKDSKSKIKISPWDYDHSFGRDGDNELNLNEREVQLDRSILFSRLLHVDWYMTHLKMEWEQLNKRGILNKEGLKNLVDKHVQDVRQFIVKNEQIWPFDNAIYKDDNSFEEEIDVIMRYIDIRHKSLELFNF